jgi:hypothetical protein
VLVTSPTCQFCLASKKFHNQLSHEALSRGVPFYVAVPSPRAAGDYVRSAGIVGEVKSWADLGFRVSGTPTLVLVDSAGNARAVMVGQLPDASEQEVLRILRNPAELKTAGFIDGQMRMTAGQLAELGRHERLTLVDVRERDEYRIWHREGAVNIPLLEFPVRAPLELDPSGQLVVDCSQFSTSRCTSVMKSVTHTGLRAGALIEGLTVRSCEAGWVTQ